MSRANIDIVKQGYAAFLSGDIPAFIELMDPAVEWDHRGPDGVPFNKMYKGKEGVLEFFETLDESFENTGFEVHEYFGEGDRVVALGHFSWKAKSTGKSFESDFAMVYTINNGKVTYWRPIFDRTAEVIAMQG